MKNIVDIKRCFGPDCMKFPHGYDVIMANRLIKGMKGEFGDDLKRINHALRVLEHARELLLYEDADSRVVAAAAILHDIGIKEAEKKHGSTAGVYQEKEGPPIAMRIMKKAGVDRDTIEHVLKIVGSHHSANEIDTQEFRIIWDADWLVNIPDEFPYTDKDALAQKIEKIFKTMSGKKRACDLWL